MVKMVNLLAHVARLSNRRLGQLPETIFWNIERDPTSLG